MPQLKLHDVHSNRKNNTVAYASFINLLRSNSRHTHTDRQTDRQTDTQSSSFSYTSSHWNLSPQKYIDSLLQTFAVFWKLYSFFWVIPRRLNFMCRHLETHCQFQTMKLSVSKRRHIQFRGRGITQKKGYKISTHLLRKEANQTIVVMNCHYSLPHVSSTTFTYRHCFAGRFLLKLTSAAYTHTSAVL